MRSAAVGVPLSVVHRTSFLSPVVVEQVEVEIAGPFEGAEVGDCVRIVD
jgi:hypothetical protein